MKKKYIAFLLLISVFAISCHSQEVVQKKTVEFPDTSRLKILFAGDMMGSPFSGIGLNGYDNNTGKYVSTWMDTMSTAILYFEGTAGPDGKLSVAAVAAPPAPASAPSCQCGGGALRPMVNGSRARRIRRR